ncbi:DUF2787 family protein [Moritella viscosa]|uniref:DUF2787 domain-containing protein n=1 Tax=Moritella viscosa TaxID=80854 RepID=A0ABY1HAH1_9GAMM|nr:DUF2787 family protein [Moritella viscosa]SGY81379.1 Putative uncharacterized protein [Moritella viscosa]SGY81540.1 Putative uncharacterized protein [Moritella viscosa]SHO23998.1 Putative uncharacterized protein [Moritella viscosa]
MTIQINIEGLSVPVSKSFVNLLTSSLIKNNAIVDGVDEPNQSDATANVNSITFNFRSPDYTAEHGGYYPAEISIERQDDTWRLCYITDFAYVGSGYCTELAKNTDFDFIHDEFQSVLGVDRLSEAAEFYLIWEANFLEYAVNFEVFELSITHHD